MAIMCPKCGAKTKSIDSRPMGLVNSQWRRRECLNPKCKCRFNTIETILEGSEKKPYIPSNKYYKENLEDLREKFGV